MKEKTTMLKSLAIGLLALTATCSTAAFAGNSAPQSLPSGLEGILCQWWPSLPFCSGSTDPSGGVHAAPEIDAAGAMAALSLLAGGLAVMRGRRSRRKSA
jgi:hypothetical protein